MMLNKMNLFKITNITFICLFFSLLLIQSSAFSKESDYFAPNDSQEDYRGIRIFNRPIRNINEYIENNWDYYIVYYMNNGKIGKYSYFSSGNIREQCYYYYKNGNLTGVKVLRNNRLYYTLYVDGNKTKKTYRYNQSSIVSYYSDKKIVKAENYDRNNRLLSYTIIKHNSDGLRDELKYFDPKNNLLESKKYFYENKVKVKEASYFPNGELIEFTQFYYSRDGMLIKQVTFNHKNEKLKHTDYEYNENGTLRKKYTYDKNGRLVQVR